MHRIGIEALETRRLLTVLLFEPAAGAFAAGSTLPQAYGDRVTAVTQSGYHYSTTGGTTPKVVADYGTNGKTVVARGSSFGDLVNVASTGNHAPFEMTLTADSGYKVALNGFDLAGSPSHDWTIKSVQVVDGSNNVLFSQSNVKIEGDTTGVRHTHFSFASPLSAGKLRIRFDASNVTTSGAAVGIDNVQFGQTQVAPPSPGSISGTVFSDVNKNAALDSGEPGLSGWTVYVDTNNNGALDAGEASTLTSSGGAYTLGNLNAGTYVIRAKNQTGFTQTLPASNYGRHVTLTSGQNATGANFGENQAYSGPVITLGNYTASANNTFTFQIRVSDAGNVATQDIEGMNFTIQIDSGTGSNPTIQSVDLMTGTVWAGHNSGAFVPAGGSQPQFKTFSVLTGRDGDYVNANGLLATVVIDTTGAAPGTYAIKMIGTKLPAFDTQFQNHVGSPVQSLLTNGTLKIV